MKHLIPQFEAMKARLPAGVDSALVMPCLHRIQADRGYVADEDIDGLATYLNVPRIQIEEVLSFYTMFRRHSIGRHCVQVCRNVSCSMQGAETLLSRLTALLGVAPGETTPDGRVTLSTVECLASCGTAPVMIVDGVYHERLTPNLAEEIVKGLK
jgi:NADH-quinone oxidoreductase subunit E